MRRALLVVIFLTNILFNPVFAQTNTIQKKLTELENSFDGRIGLYAINTANHQKIEHRSQERFPIQSTFKVLAVSAILKESATTPNLLEQKMLFQNKDLVSNSPVTEKHIPDGMKISELCAAAIMYSNNTATNLLLQKLGGPKNITAFARSIHDNQFRIDSWEPELNSDPHNIIDTSTPKAMAKSLQKLTLGNVLTAPSRDKLIQWMKDNTTGNTRIRAGVPQGWVVADKTGTGADYGISNDIAVIWPGKCSPLVMAIYTIQNKKDSVRRDEIIASVAHMVADEFIKSDSCISSIVGRA